jgi:hypothetical protein
VTVTPLYGHDDDDDPLGETYQDALRNRTKDKRWGMDLNNTSRFDCWRIWSDSNVTRKTPGIVVTAAWRTCGLKSTATGRC